MNKTDIRAQRSIAERPFPREAAPVAEPKLAKWSIEEGGGRVLRFRELPGIEFMGCPMEEEAELIEEANKYYATARQRDELTALIARSHLVEIDGYTLDPKDRKPTLIKSGERILVHKDNVAREEQRAKDLQAHAGTARKLAQAEKQRDELLSCLELAVRGHNTPEDRERYNAAIVAAGGRPCK